MMMGFMDESGSSGVANNANDFLVVSLVLFDSEVAAAKCSDAIDRLREQLGRPTYYEFHCSHNSNTNQAAFLKLLPNLKFRFITIAIKKNHSRRHASYARLAELLVQALCDRVGKKKASVRMDSNPTLYKELKEQLKLAKLHGVRVREVRSHSENLVQLVDYVVNLSLKRVKGTPRSAEWYRPIAKKQAVFIEITE